MKCSILTMNKNENKLLEQWIIYYSHLFSFEDICIVDNGSTDQDVLNILKMYEEKGIKVLYEFNSPEDFLKKGDILKNVAQTFFTKSDFVFFLDVDEFIFLNENNSFNYEKTSIINYLKTLPTDSEYVYINNKMYYNVPLHPNLITCTPLSVNKCFFRGGTIKKLDIGFHNGECINSNIKFITSLGIIHLHNKLYEDTLQAAKEKMKLRVNINDINAIKNYGGLGTHLKRILLITEKEYYDEFILNINKFLKEPKFREKLKEYGTEILF